MKSSDVCQPVVGGRVKYFLKKWSTITSDPWILDTVKQGYFIEFNQPPISCPDRLSRTKFTPDQNRAGFTYGQDWAVAQGPPQPGGLHIFHGKKL